MSKTAVIVALVVVAILGAAALFLTGGDGKPAASGPLLSVEPSSVTEVRMEYPDGTFQAVRRDAGGWTVVLGGAGKQERSWPAAQTQVHAALRIFANLTPEQEVEGRVDKVAGTLILWSGASRTELRIGDNRLGGRVLVEAAGPRTAWVDADIAEMLITTGIRAWRDPAAFPGLGGSPSVISLMSDKSLVLAKVQNAWGLRLPIAEPADPEAITRLMGIISAVRIVDFCDSGPPSHTGLDEPVAELRISSSERGENDLALAVGAATGIGDNTFVARVSQGSGAPQIVIVAGEQLAAISTDPIHYVSRQPVRCEAADVGQVVLGLESCKRAQFRRTLDGWESRCDHGEWKPVLTADAQALESLITLCTVTPSDKISLKAQGATAKGTALELGTAGGSPLANLWLAVDGSRITITSEKVVREYPMDAGTRVVEWLARR